MGTFEFAPSYRIGNEAIAYQHESSLHNQLAQLILEMRAVGTYTADIQNRTKVSDLILEATGIKVILNITATAVPNACVYIPDLDKNHPLLNNYMRGWRSNSDMHKVLNFTNGKFTGIVDKKNGKFLGDFSKMVIPVHVTTGLLADEYFTPGEVAAAIEHELGHIATYYERIIDLANANYAAVYVTERVLKTASDVDRIKLLTEFEKATTTELQDKETIVNSESGEAIYTHLITEAVKSRRNEEGDEVYSQRGFEFTSDQFVTRHGAGRDLATIIAKLDNRGFGSSSQSWITHVALQLLSFATHVVLGALVLWWRGIIPLILYVVVTINMFGPTIKIYDDPRERIDRIRNEMVGSLKEAPNREIREAIARDLAQVDKIAATLVDKPTWTEFLKNYLSSTTRNEKASREFQQNLEKLMNNDLFVAAATLETTV